MFICSQREWEFVGSGMNCTFKWTWEDGEKRREEKRWLWLYVRSTSSVE